MLTRSMRLALRSIFLAGLAALALALASCGDSGSSGDTTGDTSADTTATDSTSTDAGSAGSGVSAEPVSTTPSVSDSCSDVETYDVPSSGTHFDKDFTVDDYPTNPPIAGDHNPTPISPGVYTSGVRLGEAVHLLEHGGVIGWTNGLSEDEQRTVEDAFNKAAGEGYYQLAVVELPDLDGTFALSSWDSLQHCDAPDAAAIEDFIENHYASPTTAEAALACTGKASTLPPCKSLDVSP